VVGLWVPPATPTQNVFGQVQQPISSWNLVAEQLRRDYEVRSIDLSTGEVPAGVDVLVLIAPQNLTELGRFAVDQYLMRGGAVVAAAGNYTVSADPVSGGIQLRPVEDGIQPLLEHYGILVEPTLVLDPQNEPFPVPVERQVGGFTIQEIQLIDYPHFVDIRPDGMNRESPITANLPAVTLNWVSPLTIGQTKQEEKDWSILLQSSPASWISSSTNIQPNFDLYPQLGFPVEQEPQRHALAVAGSGSFQSYFKDTPSPFEQESSQDTGQPTPPAPAAGTIETSPEKTRLVVFGSAEFLDDLVFGISSNLSGERYLNSLQLLQNAVDWSVEDLDLLSIRARGTKVRVLEPFERSEQRLWEAGNYAVALAALVGIGFVWNLQRRRREPMDLPQRSGDGRENKSTRREGGNEEA
jgi:ABC-2 type transport system permease protein